LAGEGLENEEWAQLEEIYSHGLTKRGRAARYKGQPVCFHYNYRSNCTRDPDGNGIGCKTAGGGVFAHVCNLETGGGKYCLQKHRRIEAH